MGTRFIRVARTTAFVLAGIHLTAVASHAQHGPRIELRLPQRPADEAPVVVSLELLADAQLRELLLHGFPARLHYRVELWAIGGVFNDIKSQNEWDVIVRYDPLDKRYRVNRIANGEVSLIAAVALPDAADRALAEAQRAAIAPHRRGQFYYSAVVDVEALSLSDLDEVEQWLRGELRPAVRGERNPGRVLTRGILSLFVRVIGGERRRFQARSVTFRVD
ncbi:MAG: hypothetical protein NVS4B3_06030 [Gemmatimonadaceae bacterium]